MTPDETTSPAQIQKYLSEANLPTLTPDLIRNVLAKEGRQFADAVVAVASNVNQPSERREYVCAILTACLPAAREVAMLLGYASVRISQLIDLSKQEGRPFAQAIRALKTQGLTEETKATAQYLRNHLQRVAPERRVPGAQQEGQAQESTEQLASRYDGDTTSRSTTPSSEPQQPAQEARKFDSFHIYGGQAAYCFDKDLTRSNGHTIRIEAAKASGPRQYNWRDKVSFQLTESELPLVLGTLLGFTNRCELLGHGRENEKSFVLEDQRTKFFLSLRVRGGETYAMPALPRDCYALMAMIMTQLIKNNPELPPADIKLLVRRVCDMTAAEQGKPRANHG